jgi:hypothetical protein
MLFRRAQFISHILEVFEYNHTISSGLEGATDIREDTLHELRWLQEKVWC